MDSSIAFILGLGFVYLIAYTVSFSVQQSKLHKAYDEGFKAGVCSSADSVRSVERIVRVLSDTQHITITINKIPTNQRTLA